MQPVHAYSTEVAWTGERHGDLKAPGMPTLQTGAPPEFHGHEGVWTPEHLFVGAISSCFMTTFLAVAENSKLDVVHFELDAVGKLEKDNGLGLAMTLITSPAKTYNC